MRPSARTIRLMFLVAAASLAVAVIALWASTVGQQQARADPALTMGLDFDPSGTPADGVYDPGNLPTFETCAQVMVGAEASIDVFVLEVENLIAFESDLQYDKNRLKVVGSFTGTTPSNPNGTLFMSSQTGSNVWNTSQGSPDPLTGVLPTPDTDGLYEAAAADIGNVDGDTGYGVLARVTFEGVAPGVSPVSIPSLDLNGDSVYDTGALLRADDPAIPGGSIILNDANGDGFYDGPFIPTVPTGSIAVGQDDDGDNYPDFACPGQQTDNCPYVYNPLQTDVDNDGAGDECDGDSDGDHYWNLHEQAWGSDTLDPAKTPDICDGVDNDLDGATDEGFDFSRPGGGAPNGTPDCSEDVDTDGDDDPNPTDPDDDDDGTDDFYEIVVATDTLAHCPTSTGKTGHYAWMPDIDNSRQVTVGDILKFIPHFLASEAAPGFNYRFDWNADGVINVTDILKVLPFFLASCTP